MVLPNLTRQRYDKFPPQARRLVRVPRYAHLLSLPHVQKIAEGDRTLSRYYWEAYHYVEAARSSQLTGLLDSGMRAAPARYLGLDNESRKPDFKITPSLRRKQVTLASKIMAAMAFEMFFPTPDPIRPSDEFEDVNVLAEEDIEVGPLFRIAGTARVDKFYEKVFARLDEAGIYWLRPSVPRSIDDWEQDLEALQNMNARGLEYFVIDGNQEKLQFADRTVQEFFAAVWLTNYATKEDINRMWAKVPDPWGGEEHKDFSDVWRFAAEMPIENDKYKTNRWIVLFSPFYDSSLSEHFRDRDSPIRSTELIYRTWERMKNTAAGKIFRGQFLTIVGGRNGKHLQLIAQRLLTGFRWDKPLCKGKHGATDTGEFVMGCSEDHAIDWDNDRGVRNNPEHPVKLAPFWMHLFCVRNTEFELFEPRRARNRYHRWAVKENEIMNHPVVNVSWYDAFCFAKWLGEINLPNGPKVRVELPTEAQWEYVCRAGVRGTAFSWDGILDDNLIESGYCNFDFYSPWRPGQQIRPEGVSGGQSLDRTIPVSGLMPDGTVVGRNRWGFSQFHGNVWEWCTDWYDHRAYHDRLDSVVTDPAPKRFGNLRVIRGGKYLLGPEIRAAARACSSPDWRHKRGGFRLVAIPLKSP